MSFFQKPTEITTTILDAGCSLTLKIISRKFLSTTTKNEAKNNHFEGLSDDIAALRSSYIIMWVFFGDILDH